jgi:hypothetical protein
MTRLIDLAMTYRNAIVTLLIKRPAMKRSEIHDEVCPAANPSQIYRSDRTLRLLVAFGELSQPRLGYYEIAARK